MKKTVHQILTEKSQKKLNKLYNVAAGGEGTNPKWFLDAYPILECALLAALENTCDSIIENEECANENFRGWFSGSAEFMLVEYKVPVLLINRVMSLIYRQ